MGERSADRALTTELVASLVGDQFPRFRGCRADPFGAGWDNELFTVSDEWIFRFPKRAECVPGLMREIEIMPIVVNALGSMVPRFDYVGQPAESFPYPFVGYRMLAGIGADQVPAADLGALAVDLGEFLSGLHRLEPTGVPPTPEAWEKRWSAIRTELVAAAPTVRPLLGGDLLARAEPYLAGAVPAPGSASPRRLIHSDICPDHLLVDPHTGRLTGVIDWTDATVGDPVLDFVGLIGIDAFPFVDRVLAEYQLPLEESFGGKLEWLTRSLTLTWLAEAAVQDPGDVPKHLTWVARSFAD